MSLGEVAAYSARVIRKIVEGWTDKDQEEMGVDRAMVEEMVPVPAGAPGGANIPQPPSASASRCCSPTSNSCAAGQHPTEVSAPPSLYG